MKLTSPGAKWPYLALHSNKNESSTEQIYLFILDEWLSRLYYEVLHFNNMFVYFLKVCQPPQIATECYYCLETKFLFASKAIR